MAEPAVTLMQFASRVRDDTSRFIYLYEKAQVAAPGMLMSKQSMAEWVMQLMLFLEEEHGITKKKRPRSVSEAVTVIKKKPTRREQ